MKCNHSFEGMCCKNVHYKDSFTQCDGDSDRKGCPEWANENKLTEEIERTNHDLADVNKRISELEEAIFNQTPLLTMEVQIPMNKLEIMVRFARWFDQFSNDQVFDYEDQPCNFRIEALGVVHGGDIIEPSEPGKKLQ